MPPIKSRRLWALTDLLFFCAALNDTTRVMWILVTPVYSFRFSFISFFSSSVLGRLNNLLSTIRGDYECPFRMHFTSESPD